MTKDECRKNDEARMTKVEDKPAYASSFELRTSLFLRHSSLGIRHFLPGILLLAVTALVFHRVVGFEFLSWDDDQHIVENEYYQPITPSNLLYFWGYSYIYLYIPISYWFFGAEAWLSQFLPDGNPADRFNPAVFHLGNLLLHLGNVALTYRLLLRLVRNVPGAFFGALLFAVHPLQVESVAWISETRGTLATLFSLLALHRYLDFAGVDPERGLFADWDYIPLERRKRDYVWATAYFALALLSKPSAASLPAVVAIVDVVLLRRPWRETLRRLALWFVMAAGITGLTKYYQRSEIIYYESVRTWAERPLVAGDAYAFYLVKFVWPADLAFDAGRTPHYVAETPTFYYAWLLPVGVGLLLACFPRRRIWLGCYAIFLAAIAPVSGFVPFLYQSISTVADRYMYVPLVGFGLMTAVWIATRRNPLWTTVIVGSVLGLAAHASYEQAEHWRNDWTVFGRGIQVTPRSFMAHLHLGHRLRREGRYPAAIDHFRRMLAIRPDYYKTHYQIGVCLRELGRLDAACDEFQKALIDRLYGDAWCLLGQCRLAQGDWDEALTCFRQAAESPPKSAEPLLLMGEAYADRSEFDEADREFRRALARDEQSADAHYRYGKMLVAADRDRDAVSEFERAVDLDSQHRAALIELARACVRQNQFARAVDVARQAVTLHPDEFDARHTLGMAQRAAGQTQAAIESLEQALRLAPPASQQAAAVRKSLGELRSK